MCLKRLHHHSIDTTSFQTMKLIRGLLQVTTFYLTHILPLHFIPFRPNSPILLHNQNLSNRIIHHPLTPNSAMSNFRTQQPPHTSQIHSNISPSIRFIPSSINLQNHFMKLLPSPSLRHSLTSKWVIIVYRTHQNSDHLPHITYPHLVHYSPRPTLRILSLCTSVNCFQIPSQLKSHRGSQRKHGNPSVPTEIPRIHLSRTQTSRKHTATDQSLKNPDVSPHSYDGKQKR